WSCGLERLAREAVQGCPSEIPENPLYTRNVLHLSNEQRKLYHKEELDDPLKMRFDDFASGRSRYQWGNMVLNFQGPEGLRSLANIYRAVTLSVGCSQQTCNDKATAVCFFSKPQIKNAQRIPGQRATLLKHSATLNLSKLFLQRSVLSNTGMTDSLREHFLKMHNSRRSSMALGQMKKFDGTFFKKAADMEKMEYDCDLEADAMIYAETCALVPSYPGTRKGQGENVAVVEPQSAESFDKAAQWAMRSWFRPIREGDTIGVREVIFKKRHRNTPVARATQIVWSTTNKVGCAIGKCGGSYFVVCRYSPRGNQVDHEVYKIGTPCSQCPSKRCDTAMGLCIMP
ncbi:SCP-like protein, partial [Ostertagia ostertagi]